MTKMRLTLLLATLSLTVLACSTTPTSAPMSNPAPQKAAAAVEDPYLWLEEVQAPKALEWAKSLNQISTKELQANPNFEPIRSELLEVLDSRDRIAYVSKLGPSYYNFWRDAENPRGLWRRTTLAEYLKPEPKWETVLDLDQISAAEKENWVWKGAACLHPTFDRCLLSLSRGGADAVVVREFDVLKKAFIADGFTLPEAKSNIDYLDRDTVLIGTDFGEGSLTTSGYSRITKRWQRGTPLAAAVMVFEGKREDVAAQAVVVHSREQTYEIYQRSPDFFSNETYLRLQGNLVKLDKPDDAEASMAGTDILITLRSDWTTAGNSYRMGSLLALDLSRFLAGERTFSVLFEPTETTSLRGTSLTRNYLILNVLDNVSSRLYALRQQDGTWVREPLPTPGFGQVNAFALDDASSDDYFMVAEDFLTPSSLFIGTVGEREQRLIKQLPAFFDASGLKVEQYFASSADGTRIPYFLVARKDLVLDGSNPTLLAAYGGFEISRVPTYSAGLGRAWLERGGTYALANIRGGGEFGPRWHQAALKENRQRAFDDFIAVGEGLVKRKITSPKHLGIQGGSNGGLLVGVMLTQRPDLFGAVVSQVPLLDMKRYHKLLAGASWMGEYGDPDDPAQWASIAKYSPYQNIFRDKTYPRTLITTSTRDDRVHPGHARKMVARMLEQGHDVLYYENIEGGHGGAANSQQSAFMSALSYTFLHQQLK